MSEKVRTLLIDIESMEWYRARKNGMKKNVENIYNPDHSQLKINGQMIHDAMKLIFDSTIDQTVKENDYQKSESTEQDSNNLTISQHCDNESLITSFRDQEMNLERIHWKLFNIEFDMLYCNFSVLQTIDVIEEVAYNLASLKDIVNTTVPIEPSMETSNSLRSTEEDWYMRSHRINSPGQQTVPWSKFLDNDTNILNIG